MMRKGIHLANGTQDIHRVLDCGFECYNLLQSELHYVPAIRKRYPDALVVVRCYVPNLVYYSTTALLALVDEVVSYGGMNGIIPWNEANLGYEMGEPGAEQRPGWKEMNLLWMQDYWEAFEPAFHKAFPNGPLLHFPAWSPFDGSVGPFWPGADVYDIHCYGTPEQMLAYVDACLDAIPADKPAFISEWNFGRPWTGDDVPELIAEFFSGLAQRPRVEGAAAFIWRWYNADPNHPDLNIEGTPAEAALAAWRGEDAMAYEYGFKDLFDGFDAIAQEKGVDVVGEPLHPARYLGSDYAYQFTTQGKLEAVKLEDGAWVSYFFPARR